MPSVLITGTSTGIGAACATHLAGRGWTVYAGVRRDEDADRLKALNAGDVRPVLLDVANRDHMWRVIDEISNDVGEHGLQGLVNNAGVGVGGPIEYLKEDDWRWVFEVNFFAVVALTQAAIPLLRTGRGRIVHMGSIGGRLATAGVAPYNATKHALEALAESSRHEFARSGTPIHVSLVEPGAVNTPIWDKAGDTADEIERSFDAVGRARYGWLVDQARGFIEASRERGVTPETVAKAVEHALTADQPRARYLVGTDAKMAGNVIARAPDRLRDFLVDQAGKADERRGRLRARPRAGST